MRPLVSVIVPVYKVEEYLVRCFDSLLRQSLNDIEILLIDDASPDNCGKICEQYAAKDSRFKVIHHSENRGLSEARNTGISQATANYIMFVDSDDYVHEDFCKAPYECAVEYHADLVMFRRLRIKHSKSFTNQYDKRKLLPSGYKTQIEALNLMLTDIIGSASWNKLYHKKLFSTILYPSGYYHEDVGTTHKIIFKATSIYYLDTILYFWCYRNGSITTTKTEKNLHDLYEMHMQRYQDLKNWGYPTKKCEETLLKFALYYLMVKKPDYCNVQYNFCKNIIYAAKTMPKSFKWKQKALFLLYKYCQPLFELICIMWKKKIC